MSRLRASLAPTETDRQIQSALDRATREIEAALRVASSSPLDRAHKRRTLGDLQQALESVQRVRHLSSPPPERESYEKWRERKDQKRREKRERAVRGQVDV